MTLVLTAHGSADPRSAATARLIVDCVRRLRPGLDARIAFCEQNSPNLRDVLATVTHGAVVVPLLLADAYHARVDIPEMIAESGADVRIADVLGEDERLIHVLRQRLEHAGVSRLDQRVGVLVTAVGSSRPTANARTAVVASEPQPTLAEAAEILRERGATRLVIAPWFLAHGRITDRVATFAHAQGISMSAPLGAHRQVAETVLDRFDAVMSARAAA